MSTRNLQLGRDMLAFEVLANFLGVNVKYKESDS